jgi:flavin reductase (DIM6/NTAB) family NADH-FMN oxidoreductase RutF
MTKAVIPDGDRLPAIDAGQFRSAMGQFPTGVAVISTLDGEGRPYGITVSSFASLSLEPPLVQWSLRCSAFSYPLFGEGRHFAVNILSDDQEAESRRFCASEDRFAAAAWEAGLFGLPLLHGALAWIECERVNEYAGGDHAVFVGQVLRVRHWPKRPLLHWQGEYHRLSREWTPTPGTGGRAIGSSQ